MPVLAAGTGRGQFPAPPAPATATSRSALVLASGAGRCQRSLASLLCTSSSLLPSPQEAPAVATSRALVCVAVVDLFFAAAVPTGDAHVYVGIAGVEILQRESC